MGVIKAIGKVDLLIGRFLESRVEAEYRSYELDTVYRSLCLVLPFLGSAFLLFVIPDYASLGRDPAFSRLVAVRIAFFALAACAPFFLKPASRLGRRELVLGLVTLAGIAAFGYAIYAYREQDYYLQAMSVLLMIAAQFLVPNRFSLSVLAAVVLVCIGAINIASRTEAVAASVASAIIVDYCLMALISSLVWLRTCRSRRREYAKTRELEVISKIDPLTGLGNRRYLSERLGEARARATRYGETYALVMIDLDHFKAVNDNFGHEAGDEALKETARRLSAALRSEDSLSRWGGEEFVALISYATPEAAMESAQRLRSAVGSTPMGVVGTLSASLGVAMLGRGDDPDTAIARADRALYRAKAAGRDRVEREP
ncbi:MAG: GGDEF domain-containing protein [Spirochaetes bacterium]|nr:GGDEF domain-containing protein [Spirochaetota bacterium]MBU1081104.1 GGDEF domain-containing protein [Spirochaetota bacterium]